MGNDFFISEDAFRVWLPEVEFIEKAEKEAYNSRQISGIMSSQRSDRQGETLLSKGLEFEDFLTHGHFNDNHSQATSAIVGYPESAQYHADLAHLNPKLAGVEGWTCKGYVIKGTERADGIWELAKALSKVPNRKLGFSVEGKVVRRNNKTIEKARIRNVAITNCPVNTDAQWDIVAKSFYDESVAVKSMAAGYGVSPATQSGGGAIRAESLDSDAKSTMDDKKKKRFKALLKAIEMDDLMKAMDIILDRRPDFDDEAAAHLVAHLFKKGGKL